MKRNNALFYMLICLFVLSLAFVACQTEVEYCSEPEHPHMTRVRYSYDWGTLEKRPDTMIVLAQRIINSWKDSMKVAQNKQDSIYRLRTGEYKMLTLNVDTMAFKYDAIKEASESDDIKWSFRTLNLTYKNYKKNSPEMIKLLRTWEDYNEYSDFVLPIKTPIMADSLELVTLSEGQLLECKFTPRIITQNVDVFFNINKNINSVSFVVDSVIAEISGIPSKVNVYNGNLDLTNTYKMLFPMDICDMEGNSIDDSPANTFLRCHSNIDVTGIIYGKSDSEMAGPGIMQVLIYTTSSGGKHKVFQGKINLYHTLREANLINYESGTEVVRQATKYGVIDIKSELEIDGDKIVEINNDDWGLDQWIESTSYPLVMGEEDESY